MSVKVLLVEPEFPIPAKSKNYAAFLPIGLLKIAAYHRAQGDFVKLRRGNRQVGFYPDCVKITSLFTYWSKQVWDSVAFYRKCYPKAHIEVGGIYASLMPEHCRKSGCDRVVTGLYESGLAEQYEPAYDLVEVDYQIVHASRGCFRRCAFCGSWRIEPKVTYKKSIKDEIRFRKVIFYDNNILGNPYIENILGEIADFRLPRNRVVYCESQCGLDRELLTPEIATLLKQARFVKPRIAWDGPYGEWPDVKEKIFLLERAGYSHKEIFVFMLYNHSTTYAEMRKKLAACCRWGVQVIDCRFRPLDLTEDGYNPRKKVQSREEYYIHPDWTDRQVRAFRRAVRRQNICIRHGMPRWAPGCEDHYVAM